MDWGFLEIMKKGEFNTLILSAAIVGWIFLYILPENHFALALAIGCSVYCLIRFIVFIYKSYNEKRTVKKMNEIAKKEKERKAQENKEMWDKRINRMFNGLRTENKEILAFIILKGNKDPYNYNVLHFDKYSEMFGYVHRAQSISDLNYYYHCIEINEYTDSISVTINVTLYNLINQYIRDNNLEQIDTPQ